MLGATVLSLGASASHLPAGAVAAIVVEAAVLTLSVVGLLIIFFLDRKDRAREPNRATPAVGSFLFCLEASTSGVTILIH